MFAPVLGRSVLVRPGQGAPDAWAGCTRVVAGLDTLDTLEAARRDRRPLVVEVPDGALDVDDETEARPVWALDPSFSFPGERLAHAATANAVDARGGTPRWRWADEAVALGAAPGGAADVVLPDGTPAYVDGGPTAWVEADAAVVPWVSVAHGSLAPLVTNGTAADLAPDQLAAVTHPGGAARIIAPAGSGKTRVLTERARHLLCGWRLPASAVCLVAFNKRAADEMVARTGDLPELQVRTLNSLALAVVSGTGRFGGARRSIETIDEREVRAILGRLVDLPRRANTDPAAAWIEALSAVRLGLQPPAEVESEFGGDVDGLPAVFERYRAALAERGVLDYDEQIYRAIEVLLRDPAARRAARHACALLLVDEFQDLTPAHLLLVRLLAGPDGAVFGVGDDDQTIYGYSGASPEWLIGYRRFFPAAGEHPLEVNYRCPPAVVGAARTLLTHNRRRVDKAIRAAPGRGADAGALRVMQGDDPLAARVDTVRAHLAGGAAPCDVAVLTRVNASLAPVQVALAHHGVPVRAAIDASYLARGGVAAALAWLRLATTGTRRLRRADVALAARRPARGLSPRVLEWMSEQRDVRSLTRLASRVGARDEKKILAFVDDLGAVADAAAGTTEDVLRTVRDRVGLDAAMQLLEGARRRLDRSAQTDDLDVLVALARLHPDPTGFEGWLRSQLDQPGDPAGVVLATIHAVKGREWPHVVVHDVSAGLLPHRLAADVAEERRVFHVAITRGSATVTVVAGPSPSAFLAELSTAWNPGRPELRSRVLPSVSRAGAGDRAETATRTEEAQRIVAALKAWRLTRSRALGKPAYVVFSDATLDAIAAAMPASTSELARVKGVGPAKLEAYGDEVLALLDELRAASA